MIISAVQQCDSVIHTCYMHIHSFSDSFLIQIITEYQVEVPVGQSFHIPQCAHAKPKPPVHPSLTPVPFGNHRLVFKPVSVYVLQIISFVLFLDST